MTFVVVEGVLFSKFTRVNGDCGSTWAYVKETRLIKHTRQRKGCHSLTWLWDGSGPHWLVIWWPCICGWTPRLRMSHSPKVFSLTCSLLLKRPSQMLFINIPVCLSAPAVVLSISFFTWHHPCPFATAAGLWSFALRMVTHRDLTQDSRTCLCLLSDQYRLLHSVRFPALLLGSLWKFPFPPLILCSHSVT